MNPFDLNSEFDSFIYENVSALNKSSEKQVIASFKNLINSEDHSLSSDNAMVFDAMKKHLSSNNILIRNLACDLLHKFYRNGEVSENLKELTAVWLYKFIEKPEYEVGKMIFKKYLKFNDIVSYFLDVLDFENETILALKGFCYVLKENADQGMIKELREWFKGKLDFFKYNSNNVLMRMYTILEYLGPIEEIYNDILAITAPSLMNNKWSIVFRIYKRVPKEINKDARYISPELLNDILEDIEYSDDLQVKTNENLYVALRKVKDVEEYLKRNLSKVDENALCFGRLRTSLRFLDDHFEKEFVNRVIISSLKIHIEEMNKENMKKMIDSDSILHNIIDIDSIEDINIQAILENTSISKIQCSHDDTSICKEILESFKELKEEDIIRRASLISIPLKSSHFDYKIIVDNIEDSLRVFRKETFFEKSINCDETPVILKYPEEFSEEEARKAIEKDFTPFVGIKRFRNVVLETLNELNISDLKEIYSRMIFPEEYDLFFFYKFRRGELRQINYKELLVSYLDSGFIKSLFKNKSFDRELFFKAVCDYLSEYKVPITTDYSSDFYDSLPFFYEHVEIKKRLSEIEEIRKIYLENAVEEKEKLLLLTIYEILNLNDYEAVVSSCSFTLGGNQVFLDKVCKDLEIDTDFNIPRKPVEELLKKDDKRTIDYCLRNYPFKVVHLRHLDFSYLSDKALKIVVKRILDYLKTNEDEEKCSLEDFISISEYSKFISVNDVVDLVEKDQLLTKEFFRERCEIYSPLFDFVYSDISNNILNNYSLSKLVKDIDQDELFEFIMAGLPTAPNLFWMFLLNSVSKIRNLELILFIEEMIGKGKDIKFIGKSKDIKIIDGDLERLFAFTFPNLYSKVSTFNFEDLIYQEACNKIENVKCRLNKTSVDYSIKITYLFESDEFICYIKIPFDYPLRRPTFTTNVEKNSLLNLKIAELIRKSSKFMSVIDLWKMNIDKKVAGAKECLFCYFILHTTDGSFPEYVCIHCSNKFHNRCIERWMTSYNKRNCPMCRQPIPLY